MQARRQRGSHDMGYRVAVVSTTGNVGREMMNVFSERKFPADEVFAITFPAARSEPRSATATGS